VTPETMNAKKLKTSKCEHCGIEACGICQIIVKRKRDTLERWYRCRGRLNEEWLTATFDVVFTEGGGKRVLDYLHLVDITDTVETDDDIDIIARLVALLFRGGENDLAAQIYDTFKDRFHKAKTEMCIWASTWVDDEIENAVKVEGLLRELRIRGRCTRAVVDLYGRQIELLQG